VFTEPDPSYHGLVYSQLPEPLRPAQYILKARLQLLRDIGAAVSPFNAFLFIQGLETLSLRMERHCANALAVAEWLEGRDEVEWVAYPGLASSPWNARAKKYLPKGSGAILAFGIKGGLDAGRKFVDSLELFSHLANVGDVRSLAIHPASTTHSQLTPDEQTTTGDTPDLVRLCIGIETVDDILADLEAGFRAAKGA
jgi:O-acetylhomoserine (thiol)-lyase